MRSTLATSLLACYVAILFLALLRPLDFYARNGATWLEHADGIRFASTSIVRSESSPTRLYADLTSGRGITAEVSLSSHTDRHSDHARILSYSAGTSDRNFTLDQKRRALIVLLRTSRTGRHGSPELAVDDVFTPGVQRHLTVTYDFRLLCVYVDGRRRICSETPGGDFRTWDPSHLFVLGNEATGNRPWLGTIFRVALYNAALSTETIERAHATALRRMGPSAPVATDGLVALYTFTERSGSTVADSSPRPAVPLTIPTLVGRVRPFLSRESQLLSWPLTPYAIFDAVINVLIFVPVGLLGCIVLDARGWKFPQAVILTIAATAALSFIAESIQYFLVSRSSEMQDLVLNVVSGGLGAALYRVARRPAKPRRVTPRGVPTG